jgi:predicted transglutaminase-like cysteine proteinase
VKLSVPACLLLMRCGDYVIQASNALCRIGLADDEDLLITVASSLGARLFQWLR